MWSSSSLKLRPERLGVGVVERELDGLGFEAAAARALLDRDEHVRAVPAGESELVVGPMLCGLGRAVGRRAMADDQPRAAVVDEVRLLVARCAPPAWGERCIVVVPGFFPVRVVCRHGSVRLAHRGGEATPPSLILRRLLPRLAT